MVHSGFDNVAAAVWVVDYGRLGGVCLEVGSQVGLSKVLQALARNEEAV